MKILGQQFVMGETIEAALRRAARAPQFDYSFDMLGEAALTSADAAALFRRLRRRDRGGRPRAQPARLRCRRGAEHLREALGAASALRSARRARARSTRSRRALLAARARRARRRHRAHRRRRGSGSARAVAGDLRARVPRPALRDYRASRARRAGVPEARAARARVARRSSRAARPLDHPCGSSRARTGTARSSARRSTASTAIRCSRASRAPMFRISRARTPCCSSTRTLCAAVRDAQRAHRRVDSRGRRAAGRSSSSACTAWARSSTARCSSGPGSRIAAASTRRSAATSTCCRISCGACSRTARTLRS